VLGGKTGVDVGDVTVDEVGDRVGEEEKLGIPRGAQPQVDEIMIGDMLH
jgi:hypothetical protein